MEPEFVSDIQYRVHQSLLQKLPVGIEHGEILLTILEAASWSLAEEIYTLQIVIRDSQMKKAESPFEDPA